MVYLEEIDGGEYSMAMLEVEDIEAWKRINKDNIFTPPAIATFLASEQLILRVSKVI